jgi:M6 family metalloprotease-like protein
MRIFFCFKGGNMKMSLLVSRIAGILLALMLIVISIGAASAQEDSSPLGSGRPPREPLPPDPPKGESLSGWLSVIWGDDQFGGSQMIVTLTDESGQVIQLALDEKIGAKSLFPLNHQRVTISGSWIDAKRTFSATEIDRAPVKDVESEAGDMGVVSGSKPWVSIMCKFSDKSVEPENLSFFQNMYANTKPGLDHYWRELSYNMVNVNGSGASGWHTLPHTESYYNPTDTQGGTNLNTLANDCIAAADASVNYSLYEGINMMFNTDFDNGWAWGGSRYMTLDGTSKTWSTTWEPPWAYADISVIEHEMGHGFGLPHSSGTYGQTYDNAWDVMSQDRYNCAAATDATYGCMAQHTISYHKYILGWIDNALIYRPSPSAAPVTIHMDRLANPTYLSDYRMAILPITPGSTTHYYTVEVRRQHGYDSKIAGDAVIIHEVDTSRSRPAQVIDADGNGVTSDAGAMWTVGETFTDAAHGISVEINATSVSGFHMDITYNPPAVTDDNYEENDTLGTAYDLSTQEQVWLSTINGLGKQYDEDWYKIYVTGGYEHVLIDAQFTHSAGDIDIALYNSSGTFLTGSASIDDNEYIDYVVPAGETYYYIKVYFANNGNTYDLWWDDIVPTQWQPFTSTGSQDGWILESAETSGKGGTLNSGATTINLGDDAADKQYRGILSFNTTTFSDTATIVSVWIDIRKSGVTGTNPFNTHGSLVCDLRKGYFGTSALLITDWSAYASLNSAGTFAAYSDGWYSTSLKSSAFNYINRSGTTQCRVRFTKDDNDDRGTDILKIYSGNSGSSKPTLWIEYLP